MKSNMEVYKIWAPDDALWSQWAKPVLFMKTPAKSFKELQIPKVNWIHSLESQTMLIVDLPAESGVMESLALARLGYRPVPLYNGVNGYISSMVVKVGEIATALFEGADILEGLYISPDAPPVFMLDSNRMNGIGKQPGTFDNRWCVFPQDMPSATFLINAGIQRVIVHSDTIRNDLAHVLVRYQQQGIEIFICMNGEAFEKITVVKPSKFRSLSYRFKVIMGLIRNNAGGFGGKISEPTQSSGVRYYGYG
ncbi:MAG TPA: hypothetical protein PK033_12170 [Acetivibrio sp.]|nr:hypothetical protein [Acetivibrio sp.]HQA58617.1 hypothetical protein [Acetivibrio sp.]